MAEPTKTQQLILDVEEYVYQIIKPLCEKPREVQIHAGNDERGILVNAYCAKVDLGRVIGKKGETASALRTILRAYGSKVGARYSLKLDDIDTLDNDAGVSSVE